MEMNYKTFCFSFTLKFVHVIQTYHATVTPNEKKKKKINHVSS